MELALIQKAEYSRHFMSAKVVATLLDYGADPYKVWSYAVVRLAEDTLDEQNAQEWVEIIGVMFQAGLVPTPNEAHTLKGTFGPYPELWSDIKSAMMRQADQTETEMRRKKKKETTSTVPTLMEKLKEKKPRRSGCRQQ